MRKRYSPCPCSFNSHFVWKPRKGRVHAETGETGVNRTSVFLVLLSVGITALAQVVLKAGMTGRAVQNAIANGSIWATAIEVAKSPLIVGGFVLYFGSAIVWLGVLSKVPVSRAYPFVALGFVFTALAGRFVLGEQLNVMQMAAIALICGGVILLSNA